MNKKQMIKEQKKIKKEKKDAERMFNDDKEIYNVFKIALGVIIFLVVSYIVVNIFKGNLNVFNKKNIPIESIDNTMVIAGTMFNKSESEYYVLAFDMKDEINTYYDALVSNYRGDKTLYKLDLSSGLNSSFISDKTVISNDLTKLKLSGPTLLVIKGNNIVNSYTNEEDITKYLNSEK
jgi:hypothetical protein